MRQKKQRRQKGAALLELALCIPLMAILVMALVDIGQAIWIKQQLQLIAYEGVRYGSRLPGLEPNAGDSSDLKTPPSSDVADAFVCVLSNGGALSLNGKVLSPDGSQTCNAIEHNNLNKRINTLLLEKWNAPAYESKDCTVGKHSHMGDVRTKDCDIKRATGLFHVVVTDENGNKSLVPMVRVRIEYPYNGLFTRFINPNSSIVVDVSSVYLINTNNNNGNGNA